MHLKLNEYSTKCGEVILYNGSPDFEKLEQLDLTKVKLMWINYPNMPTGANGTLELYEKLIAFGKKHLQKRDRGTHRVFLSQISLR